MSSQVPESIPLGPSRQPPAVGREAKAASRNRFQQAGTHGAVQHAGNVFAQSQQSLSASDRIVAGIRRLADIVIAIVALIVTSPIMLAIAIIIRLDSPGPALFSQDRVGLRGRMIRFWKFRTMYADSKERFPEKYAYNYTPEEIQWVCLKEPNDPRVTKAGRWLRRSTLDELPNFWNLLKGDVTLVGPRPDIAGALPYFTPAQRIKFSVKPGITGLAQTRGRGRLRFQDQIRYDMFYARNKSLWLDMHIIFKTVELIFKSDGAF